MGLNANWTAGASTTGTPGAGNGGNNTTWVSTLQGGGGPVTNVKFSVSAASVEENAGTYMVMVQKTVADGSVSGEIALGWHGHPGWRCRLYGGYDQLHPERGHHVRDDYRDDPMMTSIQSRRRPLSCP